MSSGLIALLDDIAALAKVVATGLDDAGAQAAKASGKVAGMIIDDAAVTPRYVAGLAAERELPVIRKIAMGSLKNKLLFLLPGALVLSLLAPWAITPILMTGGAFLCLEGYQKVTDLFKPKDHSHNNAATSTTQSLQDLENERVKSAIRTDFILSAEIMAITLSSVASSPLWLQGGVLAVVGIFMTLLVYGLVAIIVKADDAGMALAKSKQGAIRVLGRRIVIGMPFFLKTLSMVGMIAMLWVGGGILIHGLHVLGVHGPEDMLHHTAELGAKAVSALSGFVAWLISASIAAVLGLLCGVAVNPLVVKCIAPAFAKIQNLIRSKIRQKSAE
jgi:uncharacterized protein